MFLLDELVFSSAISARSLLLLLLIALFVFYATLDSRRRRHRLGKLPPSPPTLPILGNIFVLIKELKKGKMPCEVFSQLAGIYGEVFSFWMGGRVIVWINSISLLKEALIRDAESFSDRPFFGSIKRTVKGKGIIFGQNGNALKKRKQLTIASMKRFGLGSQNLESFMKDEYELALELLLPSSSHGSGSSTGNNDGTTGVPKDGSIGENVNGETENIVDLRLILQRASANVIASMVFGHRLEPTDDKANRVFDTLCEFFSINPQKDPAFFMPVFDLLPFSVGVARDLERHIAVIYDYIREEIKEHRKTDFDPDQTKNLMDEFIREVDSRDERDAVMNTDHMLRTIIDLFIAATESTSTTLSWLCLYLSLDQNLQKRLHDAIDQVVGEETDVAHLVKKEELPLLEAVIMETLRLSTPVPSGIAHATSRDAILKDYGIPKGTIVMANLWHIHHDAASWANPFQFQPERHLDESGTKIIVSEAFIPFGIGRRMCLGAHLASRELFIAALALLRRFSFSLPSDDVTTPRDIALLRPKQGITNSPPTYRLVAKPRLGGAKKPRNSTTTLPVPASTDSTSDETHLRPATTRKSGTQCANQRSILLTVAEIEKQPTSSIEAPTKPIPQLKISSPPALLPSHAIFSKADAESLKQPPLSFPTSLQRLETSSDVLKLKSDSLNIAADSPKVEIDSRKPVPLQLCQG